MGKGKRGSDEEFEIDLNKSLKNLPIAKIILFAILIFGFSLRYYHIDYPVIGYHNWKTVHYITEARNFAEEGFFKHGFFVPMRDSMNQITEYSDGAHGDTFPFISIILGFLFMIIGESLVIARLVNILFSLGGVVAFYLLIKELFEREDIALLSAFLAALNPLYVFFSHNIQLINPGLFFSLYGAYLYVVWLKKDSKNFEFKKLYWAALFVTLGVMTKYSFAAIALPILLTFPYKQILKKKEKIYKPLGICIVIILMFPAWYFYNSSYISSKFDPTRFNTEQGSAIVQRLSQIKISVLFQKDFYNVMRSYIADNFTLFGFSLFVFGSILFLLLYFTKNKTKLPHKFMFGYLIGIIPFMIIMGFKLSGHNYHQFPIAPIIIFMMAFFIEVIAKNISHFFESELVKKFTYIAIIILILVLPLSGGKNLLKHNKDSRDRMFNTQFPGLDTAGDYIREHSSVDERVFHSSHQSFGVLWHANRKGYKPPNDAKTFIDAEENYNVNWVLVYQWGIQRYFENAEVFNHLKENYRLVQFAYIPSGEQVQPIYFLFRKGGTFNDTQINKMLQNKPYFERPYEYTSGPYKLTIIDLEP